MQGVPGEFARVRSITLAASGVVVRSASRRRATSSMTWSSATGFPASHIRRFSIGRSVNPRGALRPAEVPQLRRSRRSDRYRRLVCHGRSPQSAHAPAGWSPRRA